MSQRKATKTRVEDLSPGQRAYEERRAQRAGMSLESWLAAKQVREAAPARPSAAATRGGGFLTRLWRRWISRKEG